MRLIPMNFGSCAGSILKYNSGKSFFLLPVTNAISPLQSAKATNTRTLRDGLNPRYFAIYLERHNSVRLVAMRSFSAKLPRLAIAPFPVQYAPHHEHHHLPRQPLPHAPAVRTGGRSA